MHCSPVSQTLAESAPRHACMHACHAVRDGSIMRGTSSSAVPRNTGVPREDARHACLSDVPNRTTRDYLTRVYGADSYAHAMSTWDWLSVDVIWLDLLDDTMVACIMSFNSTVQWTAHRAVGFYLPPIGSKQQWPAIFQFRDELSCVGDHVEMGGSRSAPEDHVVGWVEVFHYMRRARYGAADGERSNVWMYRARGSGVWVHTGRTLTFNDTYDLKTYIEQLEQDERAKSGNASWPQRTYHIVGGRTAMTRQRDKVRLLQRATRLLNGRYDTLAFRRHVDAGFSMRSRGCEAPGAGWNVIYYTLHELVALKEVRDVTKSTCPPLQSMQGGWPLAMRGKPCQCDQEALSMKWPTLPADHKWQMGVVRCQHGGTLPDVCEPRARSLVASPSGSLAQTTTASAAKPVTVAERTSMPAMLARRFMTSGIPLRIVECTFPWWAMGAAKGNPTSYSMDICMQKELDPGSPAPTARSSAPAKLSRMKLEAMQVRRATGSILRWDLPFAIWSGGTWPTDRLWAKKTSHGRLNTAAGWIFTDEVLSTAGGWAHDAWGHSDGLHTHCKHFKNRTSDEYATNRYQQVWEAPCLPPQERFDSWARKFPYLEQRQHKYERRRITPNRVGCYHEDWRDALEDQRAYAARLALRKEGSSNACGICVNYNEMHFTGWQRDNVAAVFYVNVTGVAEHGLPWFLEWGECVRHSPAPQPNETCSSVNAVGPGYAIRRCRAFNFTAQQRVKQAMGAAKYGLGVAVQMAHLVNATHPAPIVQLRINTEQCDPRPSVERGRLHDEEKRQHFLDRWSEFVDEPPADEYAAAFTSFRKHGSKRRTWKDEVPF